MSDLPSITIAGLLTHARSIDQYGVNGNRTIRIRHRVALGRISNPNLPN